MKDYLERVKAKLEAMSPEECLELHNEAQEVIEDPIFVLVSIEKLIEAMTLDDLKELEKRVGQDDSRVFEINLEHLSPLDHLGLTGYYSGKGIQNELRMRKRNAL